MPKHFEPKGMPTLGEVIERLSKLDPNTPVATGIDKGQFWLMALHLNRQTQELVVKEKVQ